MDTSLAVALIGIGGTLMASIIGFTSNCIIENIRTKNERKAYVSKILLDKQFFIYQELSEKSNKAMESCDEICSIIECAYKNHEYEWTTNHFLELFDDFSAKFQELCSVFGKSCPFIDIKINNEYRNLLKKIKEFINAFDEIFRRLYDEKADLKILSAEVIDGIIQKRDNVSSYWGATLKATRKYVEQLCSK